MPAGARVRREPEKRPTWTMDVMILANMNEISKLIDDAAIRVDNGDVAAMLTWKATLKQFYRNIKSFFSTEDQETSENSFKVLDKMLSPTTRELPGGQRDLQLAYDILANLNELFYHSRNDLFMKFIEVMRPREKAASYIFSALPDAEKDRRVEEAVNGKTKDPEVQPHDAN